MPTTVLIEYISSPLSKATSALVKGMIKAIETSLPQSNVVLHSPQPEQDKELYESAFVQVVKHPWVRTKQSGGVAIFPSLSRLLPALCSFVGKLKRTQKNGRTVVLTLSPDVNEKDYGTVRCFFSLFQAAIFKHTVGHPSSPSVFGPVSVMPFKNGPSRFLARVLLGSHDFVVARDEVTSQYLPTIGIHEPKLVLSADVAFLMDKCSGERLAQILTEQSITKGKPWVALTPAESYVNYFAKSSFPSPETRRAAYISVMAKLVDYLAGELGVRVILIPHTRVKVSHLRGDDLPTCQDIYKQAEYKKAIKLIETDYKSEELKGILSQCEMLVACRLHSAIAATSMAVPTIALTYGRKYQGALGKLVAEQFMIPVEEMPANLFLDTAKTRVGVAWANRGKIKRELKVKVKDVQARALLYGQLIKEILENSKPSVP